MAIVLCLFLCNLNLMFGIISIVFAVVCMARRPETNVTDQYDCPFITSGKDTEIEFEFDWSKPLQGYIISGSFYGVVVSQFIAGYICYKFGGRNVITVCSFSVGILNLVMPVSVRHVNLHFMFALRIVLGFFLGFNFPATYGVISKWAIPSETTVLFGLSYVGVPFASIINFPISGFLCKTFGWTSIFYFNGVLAISSCLLYIFLLYNSPDDHPRISEKEKIYITERMMPLGMTPKTIPWKSMIKSIPLHALNIVHFCHIWGFLCITLALPMYMTDVHKFDLQSNSLLSATPYIGILICRSSIALSFESIRERTKLSRTVLRKIFLFLGTFLPSIFLIAITILTCKERYIALACLVATLTFAELGMTGGYLPTPLDLAPPFAQLITSFINIMGNVVGIISPLVVGFITTQGLQSEWNIVFYIIIGLYLFEMFVYLIFGSSETQPWATVSPEWDTISDRKSVRAMSFVAA